MSARCPSCLRQRIEHHPSGLTFDHGLGCPLLAAEDATHAADVERAAGLRTFRRPPTQAERTLVAACGITLPTDVETLVEPITRGILRRSWPGIDLDATTSSDAA